MKKSIYIFIIFLFAAFSGISQTNWQPLNTGVNKFFFDVFFTDANHGYVCGQQGLVMRTTDGGETWEELEAPPSNAYTHVFFTDNLTGWVIGYSGKISHTTDGGDTWESQTSNVETNLTGIWFMDENTGWIVGGNNGGFPAPVEQRLVLSTTDGGNSWQTEVSDLNEGVLKSVHFVDYNNGWAVGEYGVILHTSDGGNSWVEQMSNNYYHFYNVYFANENKGWVTAYYLGTPHVAVIFRTEDGGATWTSQEFGEDISINDIWFTDENTGWAVGGHVENALILHTTDGGETWMEEVSPVEQYLTSVYFSDMNHGWAAGYLGTVIKTTTVTSVEENINELIETRVYPNPATSRINIILPETAYQNNTISIYNAAGQRVFNTRFKGKTLTVSVSDFPAGVYTANIETPTNRIIRKILVH